MSSPWVHKTVHYITSKYIDFGGLDRLPAIQTRHKPLARITMCAREVTL
jgi:hypothetical protein